MNLNLGTGVGQLCHREELQFVCVEANDQNLLKIKVENVYYCLIQFGEFNLENVVQ